eukprot:CAMPEP_0118703154 /NCGR_PEP_ID=MMETSP0800-20121206/18359_1 /TAXON_ID=210618 ORGANISM="Striatella unipunctata, Strain CCMP2910" /NCGR_SAMPLE_ID=MMETSP0800 /ASSEMBLY_ACC=CAM_ASM_000638 /LENGTH=132 /DNA_ID=CAMNT_0006604575 /DNA_START=1 /DNA_END=396 /DNA_ORIENTATION=+
MHTSILTLLGYRKGSRHKIKNPSPLVAPHTDVGVITFLIFDNGNTASLQRQTSTGSWENVRLPELPQDPIFVVNIGDCLEELSGNELPSTLHRVVVDQGSKTRNCMALFVGLEPNAMLSFPKTGAEMKYEDW